jgi:hypothetical protein
VPEPYEQEGPYLFVSYKRQELPKIANFINAISDAGFNLWIDSGIHGGEEWDEILERKLMNATAILAFASEQYVESKYCRREVKFADALNNPIIPVLIEPVKLRHGLLLLFQQYQMIMMYEGAGLIKLMDSIAKILRTRHGLSH